MSEDDFLVEERDCYRKLAEIRQRRLELRTRQATEAQSSQRPEAWTDRVWTWNPDRMKWEQAQGSSGAYERSEDANNLDFKALVKDLQAHSGKLRRNGLFYWLFQSDSIVGRKKPK